MTSGAEWGNVGQDKEIEMQEALNDYMQAINSGTLTYDETVDMWLRVMDIQNWLGEA